MTKTERDAVVRLELIRLEYARCRARLAVSFGDSVVTDLLESMLALRKEREQILDALGLIEEIEDRDGAPR